MRLEDGDHPLPGAPAGGLERGGDLGRMVRVVVEEVGAPHGAPVLEAPVGPREPCQALGDGLRLQPEGQTGGSGPEGVLHVVAAGDPQLHRRRRAPADREGEARPCRAGLDTVGGHVRGAAEAIRDQAGGPDGSAERQGAWVVGAQDDRAGARGNELLEGAGQGLHRPVVVEVVLLDVGHQCDVGGEPQEGPVGLVGFHDRQVPRPQAAARAPIGQVGTEQPGRIEPRGLRQRGDHAGGGRLAVRPRHRDGAQALDEQRQGLTAGDDGDARRAGCQELDVVVGDRGRGDHEVCPFHPASTVTDVDGDAEAPERSQHRRFPLVRAGDLVPGLAEHPGDGAHAGSADADQVHVAPLGDAVGCESVHRRAATRRTRPASASAAWGRANVWMEALIASRRDSSNSRSSTNLPTDPGVQSASSSRTTASLSTRG